jgi:hypothetical protein
MPSQHQGGNVPVDDANLKVLKKLAPHQSGARKLAHQYGEALVCVRHRTDASGRFRYTTVELLVHKTVVQARSERIVSLKINLNEPRLRSVVCAAGGRWDEASESWLLPRRVAGVLNLLDRVVQK